MDADVGVRARTPALGIGSLACAAGMIVATVVGSVAAGTSRGAAAVPCAVLAIALSFGAVALGMVAAVRNSGRILGIVGVVLGVLLDPLLLAAMLPGGAS